MRADYHRYEILISLISELFKQCPNFPHRSYLDYFRMHLPHLYSRIFTFGIERDRVVADKALRDWEERGYLSRDECVVIRENIQRALNFIRYK